MGTVVDATDDTTLERAPGPPAAVAGLLALVLLLAAGAVAVHPLRWDQPLPGTGSPAPDAAVLPGLGGLPPAFVENRGQWPEAARFVLRHGPMTARSSGTPSTSARLGTTPRR